MTARRRTRLEEMVKHIVIVGGGYAGATAAHWLARLGRQRSRVTLINERAEFSERVRMHQLASGKMLPTRRLAELSARVRLIVGRVERVDPADRRVLLAGGGTVSYDSLILAPGSAARQPGFEVSGPLHSVATHQEALRLRAAVASTVVGDPVTVIGAGLTGLELATELSAVGHRVRVLESDTLAAWAHHRARRWLRAELPRLGVELVATTVRGVEAGLLQTDLGELRSALTVWAGGFVPPDLLGDCGQLNERGQLIVDRALRVPGHPEVLVAGDSAGVVDQAGRPLRMACQTAVPMGARAAGNALRIVHGRPVQRFRMRYVGTNLALGPGHGLTQVSDFDDSPLPVYFTGPASARVKEIASRGAAWSATGG
ncbi:oxidoreductase [Enemella evansiae]|uniref:NAD(P)/FAD-dependent oxidoreductase n=1 Tax=Enemella evansiae TaxID=2016499 RepID=UPI000B96D5BE|nr:FAD-dependent oxidoreductase [Enemella evansiae]OYO20611.1 oxidoreductase [Enemella evansiae]